VGRLQQSNWQNVRMSRGSRKLAGAVLYWVTVRDEDTGELLNSWSFRTLKETGSKKMEQEEALDPARQ
jgi:hypothetical protein